MKRFKSNKKKQECMIRINSELHRALSKVAVLDEDGSTLKSLVENAIKKTYKRQLSKYLENTVSA